jgi:hypothetical protein
MKPVSELRALGERNGWKVGPLTQGQIQRMSSDETDFHSKLNKEEFEKAMAAPRIQAEADKEAARAAAETERVKAENQNNSELWAGKKFWESECTPEELEKAKKEAEVFHSRYPQFVLNNQQNADALRDWLFTNRLSLTAANLAKAFDALAKEGCLVLNPAVCGIIRIQMGDGQVLDILSESLPEYQRKNPPTIEGRGVWRKTVQKPIKILPAVESLTGSELAKHPLLKTLLTSFDPAEEAQRRQDSMSADEYRNTHPEAWRDPRVYADAAEKIKREINSFRSFHPEYALTEENSKHLRAYIEKRKLPFNRESLEAAYGELVKEGYLETNREAVVSSGSTKLIDYGLQSPMPQDYSKVRAEVNRMDSKQFAEWTRDPANRKLAEEAFATT